MDNSDFPVTTDLGSIAVHGTSVDMADYYSTTAVNISSTTSTFLLNNSKRDNETEEIDPFYFYQTEQLTLLWLLFFTIIFGNMGVLANMLCGHRRKSRMNFFIKQLAFADLLVGLISVLTDIIWRYSVAWYAGNLACKIIRFLQVVVTYSSNYVLVSLSIDRYDAITRPMSFSRSWYRARILVVIAWSISVLYSLPILYLYEEKIIRNQPQCWIELSSKTHWRVYMTLVSITLFVIPTAIISGCYIIIIHTIWSQSGVLKQDAAQDTRRVSSRGIIPQAKIKTVKMTLVIVFVFILCWSPYIVFDLLQVYGQIPESQTYTAIATFVQSLAPLNSAANPLIYFLFSTSFCKTIRSTQPMSWFTSLFVKNPQRSFATTTQSSNTKRTTVTTSLMTNSGRCSGQISIIHHPKKRVMVSVV